MRLEREATERVIKQMTEQMKQMTEQMTNVMQQQMEQFASIRDAIIRGSITNNSRCKKRKDSRSSHSTNDSESQRSESIQSRRLMTKDKNRKRNNHILPTKELLEKSNAKKHPRELSTQLSFENILCHPSVTSKEQFTTSHHTLHGDLAKKTGKVNNILFS